MIYIKLFLRDNVVVQKSKDTDGKIPSIFYKDPLLKGMLSLLLAIGLLFISEHTTGHIQTIIHGIAGICGFKAKKFSDQYLTSTSNNHSDLD